MGDASGSDHFFGRFFFERINQIEKVQKEGTVQRGYTQKELTAGFERLERFGFINNLPALSSHFGIPLKEVLKLSVSEVFIALQYISVLNDCKRRLNESS